MLLSRRLPLTSLIELCRNLRHMLGAGITLRAVFRQQASRGQMLVRPIAERVGADLDDGESLESALDKEQARFPPLFLSLVAVGEQTGSLPEVFAELEKYYLRQQKLWRQFLSQITLPALQFLAAILIIGGLIYVLGLIGEMTNSKPIDPIGLGTGAAGALTWFGLVFGSIACVAVAYLLVSRSLQQKAVVDAFLLRIPAVGPCLRALLMMRFCMALRLTLETAMPLTDALDLSLRATGNAWFQSNSRKVQTAIRGGDDLTVAIVESRLFTPDFESMVAVAEESGRLPELMRHQTEFYEEEATRRMAVLTRMAGFAVWAAVATVIIIAIFRIFTATYLGPLQEVGGI